MPTVFVHDGVRFTIYPNDHAPPHVHAIGAGWEIVVGLGNGEEIKPSIREINGKSTKAMIRSVLYAAHTRNGELFATWRRIHGY